MLNEILRRHKGRFLEFPKVVSSRTFCLANHWKDRQVKGEYCNKEVNRAKPRVI